MFRCTNLDGSSQAYINLFIVDSVSHSLECPISSLLFFLSTLPDRIQEIFVIAINEIEKEEGSIENVIVYSEVTKAYVEEIESASYETFVKISKSVFRKIKIEAFGKEIVKFARFEGTD